MDPADNCPTCGAELQCFDGDAENGPCPPVFWFECYCDDEPEPDDATVATRKDNDGPR